ncbi:MAG TPA: hypothetical protein DIT07_14355 [Sphingobacteriaceae bacterium]|nr:hypothetical protein [Sphingobacteriaceae bacterium]
MESTLKNIFFNKKTVIVVIIFLTVILLSSFYEGFWLWKFLGRLHPAMVHFPISLLLFATILELFTFKNFNSKLRPSIHILVLTGLIAALIAAPLGYWLSKDETGGSNLNIHQWVAYATLCLGATTWFLLNRIITKNQLSLIKPYRSILIITSVGIIVTGHFGAMLAHGDDYLSSTLPWSPDYKQKKELSFDLKSFKKSSTGTNKTVGTDKTISLDKEQQVELNVQVRAILAHNCIKCHGEEKVKGELRLDRKDMILKGGEDGLVIIPGHPEKSELYRRINLPSDDKDVMPSKGKKLAGKDIEIINFWIQQGAHWPDDKDTKDVFKLASLSPRNPPAPAASGIYTHPIDRRTNQYFEKNHIAWPKLVDDRTYLRRIFLDIIGLLPTEEEINEFSKDTQPNKRAIWSRKLLDRDEDYAIHWMSFWNDALRNDYTGPGYIDKGRFAITDWLYQSIKSNKPYTQFVKELLSPNDKSKGFIEGIKWRGSINASQKTEMQAAQNVSQVFLGLNLKCASCHNSFINNWKLEDAYAFANIFADSTLEINRCDKPTGKFTDARMLWKELGSIDSKASVAVKREQLANNMIKPQNGRFYRTIVNRIWAQLMGRGFIEPLDMMDNKAWSQDMLDWMAYNFQQDNSDLKNLIYLITTSNTYQLPSVGFKDPNQFVSKDYLFKGRLKRRMSAEQFADAISNLFGPMFDDSMVMYRLGQPKTTPIFARASLVSNNSFLAALGRPTRETVATSRDSQATLLQALELTNGEQFNSILRKGAAGWKQKYQNGDAIIKEVYKRALGREVKPNEYKIAKKIVGDQPEVNDIQDLFWAVMLLPEFQIVN